MAIGKPKFRFESMLETKTICSNTQNVTSVSFSGELVY